MKRDFEGGRWVAELRPEGIGRFFVVGFLAFWLCGWVVGEAFAGGMLLGLLGLWPGRPAPAPPAGMAAPLVLAFLGVWLALWTLGGVMAGIEALRLTLGRDRIEFDGAGVRHRRGLGPFGRLRWHPREDIHDVVLGVPRGTLSLRTRQGMVALTGFGSAQERAQLRKEIASALGVRGATPAELTSGWESEPLADGATLMRRRQPRWVRSFYGDEIVLAAGRAERRQRFLGRRWSRAFVPAHVILEHNTDSDGDDSYALVLRGAAGRTTVDRSLHDSFDLVRLGGWVASRLNVDLRLPAHLREQARRESDTIGG